MTASKHPTESEDGFRPGDFIKRSECRENSDAD